MRASLEGVGIDLNADADAAGHDETRAAQVAAVDELERSPALPFVVGRPVVDDVDLVPRGVGVEQNQLEVDAFGMALRKEIYPGVLLGALEVDAEVPLEAACDELAAVHGAALRLEVGDDPHKSHVLALEDVELLLQHHVLVRQPRRHLAHKQQVRIHVRAHVFRKRLAAHHGFTAVDTERALDGGELAAVGVPVEIAVRADPRATLLVVVALNGERLNFPQRPHILADVVDG
mmetsp:Transcript_41355/g.127828  ORF Transcript_41355/g.127828 Transcript_41355/m.127828 type:complete len:233 (-) Transcript_41355:328-1026(-)